MILYHEIIKCRIMKETGAQCPLWVRKCPITNETYLEESTRIELAFLSFPLKCSNKTWAVGTRGTLEETNTKRTCNNKHAERGEKLNSLIKTCCTFNKLTCYHKRHHKAKEFVSQKQEQNIVRHSRKLMRSLNFWFCPHCS